MRRKARGKTEQAITKSIHYSLFTFSKAREENVMPCTRASGAGKIVPRLNTHRNAIETNAKNGGKMPRAFSRLPLLLLGMTGAKASAKLEITLKRGKKKMKANYKQFEIKTFYRGDKSWSCDNRNYNNHIVTVKNTENGKTTRFEFWCSIMHPEFETEYDVLNAFYCFVSDALCGRESFESFCDDFGYDTDSRKAEKIYQACKRAYAKFERVSGFSESEMYDFINELSEIAA